MYQVATANNSMNSSSIAINGEILSWEQVMGSLQLFGKLQPFLQEVVMQYILVTEVNSRDDLDISSTDLIQGIMDFRVQQNLTDGDKFNEWLKKENLDNNLFQNRIMLGLKIEKLRQVIAETQLESYFQEHQKSLEEVLLNCVVTSEKELAEEIKERLVNENISVEELAKEFSNSEQNVRFFKQQAQRRSLSKLGQEASSLSTEGELVGPVNVDKNWSILKVIEIIPAELDEKMKKQIEAQLFSEWLVEKVRDLKVDFKPQTS